MAPQTCPGCGRLARTELETLQLRSKWARWEGLNVDWIGSLAWWNLCAPCHKMAWPGDMRQQGPTTGLLRISRQRLLGVRAVRLCLGDFHLTQAPPEFLAQTLGLVASASVSSRVRRASSLPVFGFAPVQGPSQPQVCPYDVVEGVPAPTHWAAPATLPTDSNTSDEDVFPVHTSSSSASDAPVLHNNLHNN